MIKSLIIILIFVEQFLFINKAFCLIKVYAVENHPLSVKNPDETIGGIGGEIFKKTMSKTNIKISVEWVPWLRAIETVAKTPNTVILPIGYNKTNLERFKIVGELYSDNVYIFTVKQNYQIKNLDDISKLEMIGMIAGAPFIDFAIKYKFNNRIETSYNGERAVEKLKSNRIDGLIITGLLGRYKLEKGGIPKNIYQQGISIGKMSWLIATNKKSNNPDISKLEKALSDFKKTNDYQNILNKYFSNYK